MNIDELSVFFPAYNEEGNIENTVKKAVKVLEGLNLKRWEVLIIDDGSRDKTPEIADSLARDIKGVSAIHQPNGGYGMALRSGFKNAKYDYVVYTDSDGQFNFSEFDKFQSKAREGADVVYGYRMKRNDPFVRKLNAYGWKLAVFLCFGLWLRDVDCGFKMVSRRALNKITPFKSTRGGMINAELAIKAKRAGFKIAQVGVNHYPRTKGLPTGANIRVIIQSFIDLFTLRMTIK